MKKILIVASIQPSSKKTSLNSFINGLHDQIGGSIKIDLCSFMNLVFDISNDDCKIIDTLSNKDVSDYDFVIIRNVGHNTELGITLANYLSMKNIPFTDEYLDSRGSGKLACAIVRRRHNISTPRTIYSTLENLGNYIDKTKSLSYPLILKADNGKKGRDNYLIKNRQDLDEKLSAQPDIQFIAQEFIVNDGDYRALVLDDKIAVVIKRVASSKDTHLNNTSQGGTAVLESADSFSSEIQSEILKAAKIEGLQVAGVDIVFDKISNKHYFLEVNRAPQVNTGSFVREKTEAYARMIIDKLNLSSID